MANTSRHTMNLAGVSPDDQRLWNTYVYWARSELAPGSSNKLDIGKVHNRITSTRAKAFRAIVFAAFVLEYRVKRIYEELGVTFHHKDTLGTLLKDFQKRVEAKARVDNGRPIQLPREWSGIYGRLTMLKQLRNEIAHAKYAQLRTRVGLSPRTLLRRAFSCYNSVIDAIRVTNIAIGYHTRASSVMRPYYRQLRLPRP
jgi:hypothetical protein